MRVSVLKTETQPFESQYKLSKLRHSEVSLSFETNTGNLLMVETETETRIWTIFETETTRDWSLDVETKAETESLADLCVETI